MSFRPDRILAALERHRVRYVVIGGLAATIHGASTVTFDVDVVPEPSIENLGRLSAALDELGAKIRVSGIEGGLPFTHDAASLARIEVLNLVTVHGDLDVTLHPSGVPAFATWDEHARDIEALGVHFRLGALQDVIRSKEAAGRAKDRIALPELRQLVERTRDRSRARRRGDGHREDPGQHGR